MATLRYSLLVTMTVDNANYRPHRRPGDRVLTGCASLRSSARDGYRPLTPACAAASRPESDTFGADAF